jgi:hypothetical protein
MQQLGKNVGLIVGLVVGLVGLVLLIVGITIARRMHKQENNRRRFVVEPSNYVGLSEINQSTAILPRRSVHSIENNIENIIDSPIWNSSSAFPSRIHSAVSLKDSRLQSAALSDVYPTEHDAIDDRSPMKKRLPPLKLIDFE